VKRTGLTAPLETDVEQDGDSEEGDPDRSVTEGEHMLVDKNEQDDMDVDADGDEDENEDANENVKEPPQKRARRRKHTGTGK
jgi:hypothetical protein